MVATNAQLRKILRGLDKPPIDKIPDAINVIKALGPNPQYGSEIKIQFRIFGIESFSSEHTGKTGKYVWLVGDYANKEELRENVSLLAQVSKPIRNQDLFRVTVFDGPKMRLIRSWKPGDLVCISFRPILFRMLYCQGVLESVIKHIPDSIFQDEPPMSANQVSHASTGAQQSTLDDIATTHVPSMNAATVHPFTPANNALERASCQPSCAMSVDDDLDNLTPPPSPNNLNFTKPELAKVIENEKLIDQSNVKAVARPAIDGEPPLQVVLKPPKPESKDDLKPSKSGRKPSVTNPASSKGPATRGLKAATGKPIHPHQSNLITTQKFAKKTLFKQPPRTRRPLISGPAIYIALIRHWDKLSTLPVSSTFYLEILRLNSSEVRVS
ncbi:Aste57867_3810 [Aphanomyces stellatus]|uniref:Aste57867_3810 protein n=1 Tax=Aphanomyces stellatus TaxID=120398 RepID=A0A485KG33_9STRA|nr:hypothetical protein As57867_003799 [Aphanomyces stellatus]VFT80959.1 Aste57867_3810 [Aphanomyces stellatus]